MPFMFRGFVFIFNVKSFKTLSDMESGNFPVIFIFGLFKSSGANHGFYYGLSLHSIRKMLAEIEVSVVCSTMT